MKRCEAETPEEHQAAQRTIRALMRHSGEFVPDQMAATQATIKRLKKEHKKELKVRCCSHAMLFCSPQRCPLHFLFLVADPFCTGEQASGRQQAAQETAEGGQQ
jgi:hypothetical protein